GACGFALAFAVTRALVRFAPADLPRLQEIHIDAVVLWFTAGITLATGILFGLAPALRVSRTELVDSLREGGRSLTGGVQSRRMRGVLVVTEFAMAVVLLAGAGLLIRSLAALRAVDLGFRPERVMTLRVVIPNSKFPDRNQLAMVVGRI